MKLALKHDADPPEESVERLAPDDEGGRPDASLDDEPETVTGFVDDSLLEIPEDIRAKRDVLRATQRRFLVARLASVTPLKWTETLVAAACASLALMLERIILDASRFPEWGTVRIVPSNGTSYISVVSLPGSRFDTQYGQQFRIEAPEIGTWLGPACNLTWGEAIVAWEQLAPLLVEAEDCVPNIVLTKDPAAMALVVTLAD